jgi:hypothetical protein
MKSVYKQIHTIVPSLLFEEISLVVDNLVDGHLENEVTSRLFNIQGIIENQINEVSKI